MANNKVENFIRRVGLDRFSDPDATDGVKADWRRLPQVLAADLADLRLDWQDLHYDRPGLAESEWSWRRRERRLSASVYVSGTGPRAAREKLLDRATDTTTIDSPLIPGPNGLGDLAAQDMDGAHEYVIWVCRNVCVEVTNEGTGTSILPVAWRIQSFMQAHTVPAIETYVPKIERVDLSPHPVRVGDTLTVSVRLSADQKADGLLTRILERAEPHLERIVKEGLTVTYTALEPGRTELEIIVVDAQTLLSPMVGVFVDVLPRT